MSQENVEIVLGLQPAPGADLVRLFRDDLAWAALSAVLARSVAEGFRCEAVGFLDADAAFEGVKGLRSLWLQWLAPWQSYRTEVEDTIELGDRVVVLVRDFGRRAGDTPEVELAGAAVWTVSAGKVAGVVFYPDRARALEAVGLDG